MAINIGPSNQSSFMKRQPNPMSPIGPMQQNPMLNSGPSPALQATMMPPPNMMTPSRGIPPSQGAFIPPMNPMNPPPISPMGPIQTGGLEPMAPPSMQPIPSAPINVGPSNPPPPALGGSINPGNRGGLRKSYGGAKPNQSMGRRRSY